MERESERQIDPRFQTTSKPNTVAPMDTQQVTSRRQIRNIRFRVLIIGRANAGKTSILQRVCETTSSPVIYRGQGRRDVVRDPTFFVCGFVSNLALNLEGYT